MCRGSLVTWTIRKGSAFPRGLNLLPLLVHASGFAEACLALPLFQLQACRCVVFEIFDGRPIYRERVVMRGRGVAFYELRCSIFYYPRRSGNGKQRAVEINAHVRGIRWEQNAIGSSSSSRARLRSLAPRLCDDLPSEKVEIKKERD